MYKKFHLNLLPSHSAMPTLSEAQDFLKSCSCTFSPKISPQTKALLFYLCPLRFVYFM